MTRNSPALLVLALALAGAAVTAQDDPAPQAAGAEDPAVVEGAAGAAETDGDRPATPVASPGNDSPYDYRSSEEISEDLPVSFPVDI